MKTFFFSPPPILNTQCACTELYCKCRKDLIFCSSLMCTAYFPFLHLYEIGSLVLPLSQFCGFRFLVSGTTDKMPEIRDVDAIER